MDRTATSTQSSFNRMVVLSLAAPLSATMVLLVGELRGYLEMARLILHSIPVSELGETFSRWHCNITARSFSAVASPSTRGPIAPLLRVFSGTARSISDLVLCPTPGFNRLQLNLTIAFWWAASSSA